MTNSPSTFLTALKGERGDAWRSYTHHEFVEQLGAGSLPRESFLHYLRQDYVFLIHFARAWALAVVKSDRVSEMRAAAATVNGLIDEEMLLHIATCAEVGISQGELEATKESPANLTYTRFVMDKGFSGDLLDLLVALSPCTFGYGEIGTRLAGAASGPQNDHPYREWIETYSSAGYQESCITAGALLDAVAQRTIGADFTAAPRWSSLVDTFAMASELEAGFWQMGLDRT
jgi:thiaminase/transcriptional activator TenA